MTSGISLSELKASKYSIGQYIRYMVGDASSILVQKL